MLCTVEGLADGFDTGRLGMLFTRWLNQAHWTPWQEVFDVGGTILMAINRLSQGVEPEQAGLIDENNNGNGSLMRILPVTLRYFDLPVEELLDHAHRASALTHRHVRGQMACGFYCTMVSALLQGADKIEAYLSKLSGQRSRFTKDHRIPENCLRSQGFSVAIYPHCLSPASGRVAM
jgi:ADP-ribosylglycohydrolase